MMRCTIVAGAVLAGLMLPTAANATVKPFAVKSASPANGAVIAPPFQLNYQIKTDAATAADLFLNVELSTSSILGQDGTLANEFLVPSGSALLSQGDAFPDTWSGHAYPTLAPGTYYWQVNFTRVESAPPPVYSEINTYVSPTYTLVVRTPPPPPPAPDPPYMTKRQAVHYTRNIIRDETGHKAYDLKSKCRRVSDTRFRCKPSWFTTRRNTASTWVYAGTLRLRDDGEYINYSFSGARAKYRCIQRRGVDKCARKVSW